MANPVGNELVSVIGVNGAGPAATTEYFTIAQLSGSGFYNIRLISSGASDTATTQDNLIAWNSATASAKVESIPAPTTLGDSLTIKDSYGNAATYNITITPSSGTIDGAANYVINQNYGSITLVANGTTNWMVV